MTDAPRIALHEAGHATLAALVGLRVRRVAIRPSRDMHGYCEVSGCDAQPRAGLIFAAAGAAVEHACYGSGEFAGHDLDLARDCWRLLGCTVQPWKLKALPADLAGELERVAGFFDAVGTVARALLQRAELTEQQFRRLAMPWTLESELGRTVRQRCRELIPV